jgi:hypothetical protein
MSGARAIAFAPGWQQDLSQGEKILTILDPFEKHKFRVLAHELWHLLANRLDSTTDVQFFCPSLNGVDDDLAVNTQRRFTETIKNDVQRVRPVGELDFVGNTLRKPL